MVCNIFGGADIGDYSKIVLEEGMIVAADKGFVHCRRLGLKKKVDMLLGDFDSLEELPEGVPIMRVPSEKDDTDMMLAVKWAIEKGCREFRIYGGIGGRMGHTVSNIQTLLYVLHQNGHGILFGDSCDIEVIGEGEKQIKHNDDIRYISVFSVTEKSEAVLSGLKYSGEITFTKDFPLGVSNETIKGKTGSVLVKSGVLMIIYEKK